MTPNHPTDEMVEGQGPARLPSAPADGVGPSLIRKIDICRGLFAFLVVAAHAYDVCWVIHPDSLGALPWIVRYVLYFTLQAGFYWVMGFFVISCYCIQLSAGRLLGTGRFPLGIYLAARLTRIMPLYYAGLLFTLVVEGLVAPIRPNFYPDGLNPVGWISQLFFAQRLFQTFGSFAPSWTITYELFYYVFFGLLAAGAARHRASPSWLGMGLCVALGGVCQGLYAIGYKDWYTLNVGMMFGLGADWFLGALVAVHGPSLVRHRPIRALAAAWPVAFGSAVALRADGRCPLQAIYLVLGIAFALMILRFQAVAAREAAGPRPAPSRFSKVAEVMGLASYPTYLFHGPVMLLLATANARWGLISDWRATWSVLVGSGIGVGVALGWVAERPIMAWRADLLGRLKGPSRPRPAAIPSTLLEVSR